jgi:hypothetical protein
MLCGLIMWVIGRENVELYFLMEQMRDWKEDKEKKVKQPPQTLIANMNTPDNDTMTLSTSEQKRKQA